MKVRACSLSIGARVPPHTAGRIVMSRRLTRSARIEALESRQLLSVTLPDHAVRIAYLIPSGRTPQRDAVATLRTSIKWYQDWFADQMERNGFGRKTFAVETL